MSLDRAQRLGHRIETITTTPSRVARETTPPPQPSPAETVRSALDAAIATAGLSRNVGERVLAAITTDPGIFASASLGQLKAYVGAAVGAGDPIRVRQLIAAAPEAHREVLSVRARDAFWFQSDLDSWALAGLFSKYPRPVLNVLRSQAYWRRGTILVDSGLDDRLRLAQALQIRWELGQAPPELTAVLDLLRDTARPVEAPRFDALRTMGPPQPGQSPSRLAGYQRGLVTWARLEIDPTLDPEDPTSYDKARRLGWYHDRATVLRFLAQGARLDSEETARVVRQVDALSEVQRLRFVGWLLGSKPEADKVGWIRSQGRADDDTPSLGQRVDAANETQSFLAAFKVSAPAELGKIDDLPRLLLILDQWDLTARGYVDAMRALRYQQLLREHRLAEQGKPNNRDGFHRSMKLWQSGGPEDVVDFIQQVTRARDRARSAWSTLVGLKRYEGADSVESNAVTAEVASARGVLGESQALLSKLAPDAKDFVDQIFERDQQTEALRSQATEEAANSSWLAKGLQGAFSAVGSLVDRLKDPGTWKTALEVGLEVAGAAFSGGASVLIKLVHWLVTTGQSLKATIEGAVAKIGILSEPGGFAKLVPLGGLFTSGGLISTAVGALFGDVPPEPQLGSPSVTPKSNDTKTPQSKKTPSQRLLGRIGSLVETVRGAAAGVVGPTWAALRSIDITPRAFFQHFARAYYRLIRYREKLAGAGNAAGQFVSGLRQRLDDFFQGLTTRLGAAAKVFAKPAEAARRWVREITSSGMEYLIGLLITNPPSAILRTTFKAAASLLGTSTGDLGAMLKQKLAGVPLIGDMIAKIESTVEGAVAPVLTKPAEDAFEAGTALFGQAGPLVEGLQGRFGALLDQTDGFVGRLTGGLWAQVEEPKPEATTSEAPSPDSGDLTQGKRIQRTKEENPGQIVYGQVKGKLLEHGVFQDLDKRRQAAAKQANLRLTDTTVILTTTTLAEAPKALRDTIDRRKLPVSVPLMVYIGGLRLFGTTDGISRFLAAIGRLRATEPQLKPLFDGETTPANLFTLYETGKLRTLIEVRGDIPRLAKRWFFGAYAQTLGHTATIHWALTTPSALEDELGSSDNATNDDDGFWETMYRARGGSGSFTEELAASKQNTKKLPLLLCYEFIAYVALQTDRTSRKTIKSLYQSTDTDQEKLTTDDKFWKYLRADDSKRNVYFDAQRPETAPESEHYRPDSIYTPRGGQLVFFWWSDGTPAHVAISLGGRQIVEVTSPTMREATISQAVADWKATRVTIGDPPSSK